MHLWWLWLHTEGKTRRLWKLVGADAGLVLDDYVLIVIAGLWVGLPWEEARDKNEGVNHLFGR